MTTTNVIDGVKLLPNGCAEFVIEGITYMCRRPRFGELRRFVDAIMALDARHASALNSVEAIRKEVGDEAPLPPDATALYEQFMRDREDITLAWHKDVVETLSDKKIAAIEDLPGWMAVGDRIREIIEHWRTVPFQPLVSEAVPT